DSGWQNEMLRSNQAALIRLDDLIEEAKRQRPEDFLSTTIAADDIRRDPKLYSVVERWNRVTLDRHASEVRSAINSILRNRYIICQEENTSQRLFYKELGEGLFAEYDTWRACAVGAPM